MLICPKCRTTFSSAMLSTCYRDGERLVDYERFVADEQDPLRNKLIGGKYRLAERVGQGGMGTIYRATQSGLNRPVAVKILKRELNLDPDTVARFHREANAMSMLTHPNTVRVYDFGQTEDGLLYLVMELLGGELLTHRMERPIDVIEAVHMTQQILHSLGEAHRKAIVHRDLKPDNVFVQRPEGHGEPVIKVLDFGIAKVVAPDRRVDQFETQAGTVFGTPRYMSPEQAQGNTLDGRSDLYSVGALLYQMLTERAPFTDEDAVVVMAKHIRELPEPPNRVRPTRAIPNSLNDVVMRALAKDPAARFQEAGEFARALEDCVPDVVRALEAGLSGATKPVRSQRWSYLVLAAVLFGAGYFGVRAYAKLRTANDGLRTTQLEPAAAPPLHPATERVPASAPADAAAHAVAAPAANAPVVNAPVANVPAANAPVVNAPVANVAVDRGSARSEPRSKRAARAAARSSAAPAKPDAPKREPRDAYERFE